MYQNVSEERSWKMKGQTFRRIPRSLYSSLVQAKLNQTNFTGVPQLDELESSLFPAR